MKGLAESNRGYVAQALDLLRRVPPEVYRTGSPHGLSSVGAHIRHILDHYDCLLAGVTSGRVDYDSRARDEAVERDPAAAAVLAGRIAISLGELTPEDAARDVEVRMDCGESGSADVWSRSSVQRELQFLVSHTVHHFALIKGILIGTDTAVPEDFGVAPSTLAYRSRTACAP
jgi:hypothetical protein